MQLQISTRALAPLGTSHVIEFVCADSHHTMENWNGESSERGGERPRELNAHFPRARRFTSLSLFSVADWQWMSSRLLSLPLLCYGLSVRYTCSFTCELESIGRGESSIEMDTLARVPHMQLLCCVLDKSASSCGAALLYWCQIDVTDYQQ
jgi:hypothetical protein